MYDVNTAAATAANGTVSCTIVTLRFTEFTGMCIIVLYSRRIRHLLIYHYKMERDDVFCCTFKTYILMVALHAIYSVCHSSNLMIIMYM